MAPIATMARGPGVREAFELGLAVEACFVLPSLHVV
jgi:hypothetical protein